MPLDYLSLIAQTAAPTFQEESRAQLIAELWQCLGYTPTRDDARNVLLHFPVGDAKNALAILVHLDTVFPLETDLSIYEQAGKLYGPGLGDNSASLAVVTAWLRDFDPSTLKQPLWIVATTGEEGLGDLRGAKHFLANHHEELAAVIAVDGYLGSIVTTAVGIRRFKVTITGEGGHASGQFPSAIHAASKAIVQLYDLYLPPHSTLNVGMIHGGQSINSIASEVQFWIDVRSVNQEHLSHLEQHIRKIMQVLSTPTMQFQIEEVGNRAGGALSSKKLLDIVQHAARKEVHFSEIASSTDANATIPYALPALTLGVYRGDHAHRTDEWVEPKSLERGLQLFTRVIKEYQHRPLQRL